MNSKYKYYILEDSEEACIGIIKRMNNYINWGCLGYTGNISEAIELIKKEQPDLLFLDWSLNGGSGFEVCESLHKIDDYNPYIIFNTAYQKENPSIPVQIINKQNIKVDKYILKPIWEDLRMHLEKYLLEAAEKAEKNQCKNIIHLKDTRNRVKRVDIYNLVLIEKTSNCSRFKSLYFSNKTESIVIEKNWEYCISLLQEFNIDFFHTNSRKHLVIRKFIKEYNRPKVYIDNYDKPIIVVKEKIFSFEKWLYDYV